MPETERKFVIVLEGLHCAACVARAERAVAPVAGVKSFSVHLPTKTAFLVMDETGKTEAVKAAIESAGYKVVSLSAPEAVPENAVLNTINRETRTYAIRTAVTLALFILLLASSALQLSQYTVFIITAVIWGWCGSHFHAGFLRALKTKSPDMNTLVSMSTSAAFFYSTAALLFPSFFRDTPRLWDDVALLILFINLGRFLESYSKRGAGISIANLMRMKPKFARVLENGKETSMPVAMVKPGMLITARPGEQIAVDGEITEGTSALDESLLTGESLPVDKTPGDKVYAATINQSGALVYRAEKTGADMAIARIIAAVQQAQSGKAAIQKMVDKVSYYFVPAVMGIAFLTFCSWLAFAGFDHLTPALTAAVAVLAVACPCAMGLAVPMATVVGFGRAAAHGILIRNTDALERVSSIEAILLDKTGTLTEGKLAVTGVYPETGTDESELLRCALVAEQNSEHPFAETIRRYAEEKGITAQKPESLQILPGHGIKAKSGDSVILAGRTGWLAEEGVPINPAGMRNETQSVMGVSKDGKFLGYLTLADKLRSSAKDTVEKLRALNMDVVLVSGDREPVVADTAEALGLTRYYAGVFPEEKAAIVESIQKEGKKVAFVGDGFNDAPALSRADIGISLSTGTDIAIESSDLTLMRQDLQAVLEAINLSRAIRRTIKENLAWAFIYNIILIPLAAGVLYPVNGTTLPPAMAAAAMALSSFSVVMNSLRLRKVKI